MNSMVGSSKSHAILDAKSRALKARKIEIISKAAGSAFMGSALEVGCGSGFISEYLAKNGFLKVHAVDVVDERQIKNGFEFQLVVGTQLPFGDDYFDFVISNHVIEHVGPLEQQIDHLKEIYRTMKPGGILYFAVPNRWRLIEPHYRLPLLSWLPAGLASYYVQITTKEAYYDCRPLSILQSQKLLRNAGFDLSNLTLDAIRVVGEIEGGRLLKHITRLPRWIWIPFLPVISTIIFVCKKPE